MFIGQGLVDPEFNLGAFFCGGRDQDLCGAEAGEVGYLSG